MSRDYGEEPRDYERRPPKSSNTALWIVLGVLGGILLICGGGAALVIFGFYSLGKAVQNDFERMQSWSEQQRQQAEKQQQQAMQQHERIVMLQTADGFLTNLRLGFIDVAYNDMSAGFRRRTSKQQLQQLVDQHPVLKANAPPQTQVQTFNELTTATVTATFTNPAGQETTAILPMIKEGGVWKVENLVAP
jgi:flagellar basal body-associated protein FliL